MYKHTINLLITTFAFTACASASRYPPGTPLPSPSGPETVTKGTDLSTRLWTFNFRNQAHTYYSTSQTTFDSDPSDSASSKDTVSITTQFTVTINRLKKPINIFGHIDSILLNPGAKIGTDSQKLSMPIYFSGIINSGQLVLNVTTKSSTSAVQIESNSCDSPASSLLGEIRGGIGLLPPQLQPSSSWTDTISTVTCSGSKVLSSLEIIRFYQVIGERTISSTATLLIKRTEQIHLMGKGAQDQHQIKLEGEGTSSSEITLDLATGTTLLTAIYQQLRLTVISSGQRKHFTQKVKQQITLLP
jgi:hypothetical protein